MTAVDLYIDFNAWFM